MTARRGPKLLPYTTLGASLLIAALISRRPELAVLAAPFAVFAALGLLRRPPQIRAWLELDEERAIVGESLCGRLVVRSAEPVARVELLPVLGRALRVSHGAPIALSLGYDAERLLGVELHAARFGSAGVGAVAIRARDRYGMVLWESTSGSERKLHVYPTSEQLRRLVAPAEAYAAIGAERTARRRSDGLEFADTRPYVPGDRLRAINWRATARLGELIVDERYPDRNADVLLFVDSFAEVSDGAGGTLELGVRAASSLADAYLARRDRVGLVSFGGILRWLEPGSGPVQRYRLVEAMLETRIDFSYAWKGVESIPARALTPGALVLAVTPLIDERSVAALLDLRRRGHDVAVVEVDPDPFIAEPADDDEASARRLWRLRRDALRSSFRRAGIAVQPYAPGTPLAATVEGVRSFRRHGQLHL